MNRQVAELLKHHFDIAFAAPDGVKKLRELILTLAMQGKLAQQDPNDPPASQLLKEIEAEKKRLVKEGKTKAPKPLPEIKQEEIPYALPQGWKWVKLGELGISQTGTTPPSKNRGNYGNKIPFIGPGDIKNNAINYSGEGLSEIGISNGRLIEKGSVLMVCIGGSIGKRAVNAIDVTCNQQINSVTPYKPVSVNYLFHSMGAEWFQKCVVAQSGGSATPIINKQKWSNIAIPLPPVQEQHRIVAKIDQLMARCDELEKLRAERERKRLSVHTAALKQLLDAPTPASFAEALQFLSQHFGELYTARENLAELRKAILQLAVMGKLVPQDPNDPPASQLLKEIEAEKKRLVKERKIKALNPLPEIEQEEAPYSLPDGWKWIRFGEITITRDGERRPVSKDEREKIKGDYDYYGASGVIDTVNDYIFDKDLLLMGEDGANLINRSTPIAFIARGKYWVNNHAHVIDAHDFGLLLYLEKFINAIDLKPYVTGSAQPKMNQAKMNGIVVALPPALEQHRIVAKIDQLMAFCDTLEKQIDASTSKQTELLNAVMAQI
jgi:type I restriction enzyme, S subunit